MAEGTQVHLASRRWVRALLYLGLLLLIAWLLPQVGAALYDATGWFFGATIMVPPFFFGFLLGLWAPAAFPIRSGVPYWYVAAFLLPLMVWEVLSRFIGPGGSLANAVVEPFWLGVAASAVQILRLVFSASSPQVTRTRFILSVAVVTGVAVSFAIWFPDLPE